MSIGKYGRLTGLTTSGLRQTAQWTEDFGASVFNKTGAQAARWAVAHAGYGGVLNTVGILTSR
jgi:hypothetical protein